MAMTASGQRAGALVCALMLAGCAGSDGHRLIPLPWPHKPAANHGNVNPDLPAAGSGRGGYYKDDGPGPNPPPNLIDVPDAVFRVEPYAKFANRPYSVFGQTYTPLLGEEPFVQRGVASWYGVKFHGQRTSSGELYDMYKMTAAHPTLPIPSYARITSIETGNQVVVRINDRGPFHASRIVDVSYTAALKLGLLGKGSHQVEIERILPNDPSKIATVRRAVAAEAASINGAPEDITKLMLQDRIDFENAALMAPAPVPKAGFYLQLGAYSRADKAQEASVRLRDAGIDAATLDVAQAGAVYRLYRGPFETRALAQEAARALPPALALKPIVVRR